MMERTIRTEWVGLQSGTGAEAIAIDAYAAIPEAAAGETFSTVVVIQEIFGVNAHIRDVTERVAKLGYVAIAPAIYQRQIKNFERGYDADAVVEGRKYKEQTRADELLRDVHAAMDYGRSLPQGKAGPCGSIGFCFGGHVVYLAATLPDMAATASFYGAGITTWCPGEAGATVDRTGEIKGRLCGFFGTADGLIPSDHVDTIKDALVENGVDHTLHLYDGADHGFFCDRRGSYNAQAAADAWGHVVALFGDRL
ncbi:MAG: dienelactone hydrolase family protein [Cyanobacteria bacterium P01_D01_bin.73]